MKHYEPIAFALIFSLAICPQIINKLWRSGKNPQMSCFAHLSSLIIRCPRRQTTQTPHHYTTLLHRPYIVYRSGYYFPGTVLIAIGCSHYEQVHNKRQKMSNFVLLLFQLLHSGSCTAPGATTEATSADGGAVQVYPTELHGPKSHETCTASQQSANRRTENLQ